MNDLFKANSGDAIAPGCGDSIPGLTIWASSPNAADVEAPTVIDVHRTGASVTDENYVNRRRLHQLKKQFTPQLMHLIMESDFEYGIESSVDVFIRSQMKQNDLATKSWLSEIFLEHFGQPTVLIGLLRAISRLSYLEVWPEGLTMALSALPHVDIEVRECGIRAFENWGNLHSLEVLENLHVSPAWLQDYVKRVILDLREELNVKVDKKD